MFLRALRVCNPEHIDEEITFSFNITNKLKYPKYFIDICFTKAKHILYKTSISSNKFENDKNILVLPYNINLAKI